MTRFLITHLISRLVLRHSRVVRSCGFALLIFGGRYPSSFTESNYIKDGLFSSFFCQQLVF